MTSTLFQKRLETITIIYLLFLLFIKMFCYKNNLPLHLRKLLRK